MKLVRQPQASHPSGGMGLGRQRSTDPRDRRFRLTAAALHEIPRQTEPGVRRRTRPWKHGPILNQGATNQCTVYAAKQQIQSAPRMHIVDFNEEEIYRAALEIDEFAGDADEGTSERAVQKILQDRKLIASYLWADDEDIAKEYLLTRGMLLFGSDWLEGCDTPDKHGYIEPTGAVRGGHEYAMQWWYNTSHSKYPDTYQFINSWGEDWGDKGIFRMKADAVRFLWLQSGGDLVSPLEPTK